MDVQSEIYKRIERVKKNNSFFLDLSGLGISKLPELIFELDQCIEIDLSYNQFTTISEKLFQLKSLQILNLSNNNLLEFEIGLNFNYSIKQINISNNLLHKIPILKEYYFDVEVIFDNNPFLNYLPDYISDKDLDTIEFYTESLRYRRFNKQLFEFKLVLVGAGDVGKTSLVKVLADDNYQLELGKETKTDGIEINKINFDVFFPATKKILNSEPNLDNLYFKSFVDYYESSSEYVDNDEDIDFDIEYLEGKRTHVYSVWNQLSDDFKLEIDMRNIESEAFEIRKEVTANVWDFGGQEIYINTHQFFLTNNSIYIILWDSRKDTEALSFEYWLNLLNTLTFGSHIIIAMNKCEIGIKSIDEDYFINKHSNIIDFVNISCLKREGIEELKLKITNTITKLKNIGDSLPFFWEKIRYEIKNTNKDYISYSDLLRIGKEIGKIEDTNKIKIISQYLHDIGDIIHFQNDNNLKAIVIINPEWATKAVYLLFDTIEIQKNKGKFTINELESYWDLNIYPIEKHLELIYLMEKFEICFKQSGTDYFIIPDFLDYEKKLDNSFFQEVELRYKIEYESLPSNLFTRLICKLSYMLKKDMFWKSSAYLIKENSTAYIKYNKIEKSINVDLFGIEKSQMLSIISHEIDKIHLDLKMTEGVNFIEKFACNCNECIKKENPYYYKKSYLLKLLDKKIDKTVCEVSIEEIVIKDLLSGYKTSNIQFELIYHIFNAVYSLQSVKKSIGSDENDRNTFVASQLSLLGVNAKDQSLHGNSKAKIKMGELDIKFTDNNNLTYSLFEGVNLSFLDSKTISEHIEKTLKNYNPTGLNIVYIGVYFVGMNFNNFISKYEKFLNKQIIKDKFNFVETKDVTNLYNQYGNSIIIFKTKYFGSSLSKELILYHFLVDLS